MHVLIYFNLVFIIFKYYDTIYNTDQRGLQLLPGNLKLVLEHDKALVVFV